MASASGAMPAAVAEGAMTALNLSGVEAAEGVPNPGAPDVAPPALTPGTPEPTTEGVAEPSQVGDAAVEEAKPTEPKSPVDVAGTDPEDEVEYVPAKRQKLHREIRVLAQGLESTTEAMNGVTATLAETNGFLKTHAAELQRMASDLGYSGISQKYFLASLTAYTTELWQVEGGKRDVNTSLKSAVIAVGPVTEVAGRCIPSQAT